MSTLFFYGTLRHIPLLETVLGRAFTAQDLTSASINGYQAFAIEDGDYPTIMESDGAAQGILVRNLSETDIAKLNFYEGGFDYQLREVQADTEAGKETAQFYFPTPDRFKPLGPWSLTAWEDKWGDLACIAAEEVMSYFGKITDAELEFRFPMIRVRAAAKLAAAQGSNALSPSGFTREDVTDLGAKRPFTGFFSLQAQNVAFRQYDGDFSQPVTREVFAASDATIVLPYDPVRDRVMLIEQFRPGPYARGDNTPWMLEPIAGRIDPGETAEQTAYREAVEEAGIDLKDLLEVAKCYASPGCSTEFFNIFIGIADLPDAIVGTHGLETEAEDIKSYLFGFEELMDMVETFQAANAPLVLASLWLARHRDRLRSTS